VATGDPALGKSLSARFGPLEWFLERLFQAAFATGRTAAAVDSSRTETRFDTPDSSIVTP
jgi:hypothetical protein